MKKIKKIFISAITPIVFITSISCDNKEVSKNTENNSQKNISEKPKIEYKTEIIDFKWSLNNPDSYLNETNIFNNFIHKMNNVNNLPNEYNKININIPFLNFNKTLDRNEFINKYLSKINSWNLQFQIPEKRSTNLNFSIENKENMNEMKKILESDFSKYYIDIDWFENSLKKAIEDTGAKKLKISLEDAITNKKEIEYNKVIKMIKDFLKDEGLITFSDDIIFEEINQDILFDWSIKIKFKKGEYSSKLVKLNLLKPKKEWTKEAISEKNKQSSFIKKIKLKMNDYLKDSTLENFIKSLKAFLIFDENRLFSKVISLFIIDFAFNFDWFKTLPPYLKSLIKTSLFTLIFEAVNNLQTKLLN